MSYRSGFPQDRVFTWDDVKFLHKGQYILMHSVIYRTKLLRECGLELPEHTFYVDNIFVYHPLPYVKYHVLPGCEFLPVLHRTPGSVRQ